VFVAPNAAVIGEVLLLEKASVWYGAVVRGDKSKITIGSHTNVQDRAVISTVSSLESGFPSDVEIGSKVTIGHGALLTSCIVGDNSLIGQGAIVQAGSVVGSHVMIAAGAVVLPNTIIPNNQLWAGNPAKFIRDVTDEEIAGLEKVCPVFIIS
jgi:gamma-carbonic anhydrase